MKRDVPGGFFKSLFMTINICHLISLRVLIRGFYLVVCELVMREQGASELVKS